MVLHSSALYMCMWNSMIRDSLRLWPYKYMYGYMIQKQSKKKKWEKRNQRQKGGNNSFHYNEYFDLLNM